MTICLIANELTACHYLCIPLRALRHLSWWARGAH